MKKNLLVFMALLAIHLPGVAQDLIVRHNGDSINARITQEKAGYIHFTFKHGDEIRNSLLPKSQVAVLKRGYYAVSEVPEKYVKPKDEFPRFRIALGGGYSYRLAPISEDLSPAMTEYIRGLKHGFHFQGDLAHYFSPMIGLGAYYSITHATTEGDIPFYNGIWTSTQSSSARVSAHFIGPQFSLRLLNANQRNAFLMNIALGYVSYIQETRVAMFPSRVTGNTFGIAVSYAYEIGVSDNFAVGAKLSAILANLTSYKEETNFYIRHVELQKGQYENLSRVDLSLYLRFGKM